MIKLQAVRLAESGDKDKPFYGRYDQAESDHISLKRVGKLRLKYQTKIFGMDSLVYGFLKPLQAEEYCQSISNEREISFISNGYRDLGGRVDYFIERNVVYYKYFNEERLGCNLSNKPYYFLNGANADEFERIKLSKLSSTNQNLDGHDNVNLADDDSP